MLLALLFAVVMDKVTENAKKGWMKQIFYVDDLVLIEETMEEMRENFDKWRNRLNFGKTKVMVNGMEGTSVTQ